MMAINILFFCTTLISFVYWIGVRRKRSLWIKGIFFHSDKEVISKKKSVKEEVFDTKLLQAGLTYKQIKEFFFVACVASGSLIFLIFFMNFSMVINLFLMIVAAFIPLGVPFLYIEEQRKVRRKKIEADLAVFLDLVIIILEGGGGLNNAIDEVTLSASSVIGPELIEEMVLFKNELINYNSEIAYDNLIRRTGSDVVATLVGFLKLSEETGIGVKNVFENQAQEIKNKEVIHIEKKAAMMNVNMTFTMFLFVLPAIIAMMALPLAHTKLFPGM